MTYLSPGNYDDMRDWKHREENPGYEREVGLTAADLTDDYGDPLDPDLAHEVAAIYAHDNNRRRENNHRADLAAMQQENDELRALLSANGITPPPARD